MKIVLPTMAVDKEDVNIMLGLLERLVGGRYEIGLEIIGKPVHFQEEGYLKQIGDNIRSVAQGAFLVIHGFSGIQVYESGIADMRTEIGRALLITYLELAKDIGANYIHIHSSAGYKGDRLSRKSILKVEAMDKIRVNMISASGLVEAGCPVGIENLPTPSMGDVEKDPHKIWRDCVDSLEDCIYIVRGTDLKITLDTCHYAINQKGRIDLIKPVKRLSQHLWHFHISDTKGYWIPNRSLWQEGVVPGNGRIGEESFKELFSYLKENHPDISLCIEVFNKDYRDPVETEESIRRILGWLE